MKQNRIRNVAFVLMLAILFVSCVTFQGSVYAEDLRGQQSALESRLAQLKKDQEAIAKSLSEARSKTNEQLKVIELMYNEIDSYQSELNTLSELIEEYSALANEKQRQIEELNARMDKNFELFKRRLVFAQESGDMSLIDFILGSSDLADILSRSEQINDMLEYDRKLIESLVSDRQAVEAAKAEIEDALKKCEEKQAEYAVKLEEMNKKVEEANQFLEQLKADQAAQQAKYNAVQNSKKAAEKELDAIIKRIAEEATKNAQSVPVFNGTWVWPLPRSFPGAISQYFHSGHSGLDIHTYGKNDQIPALSVAAGTVIRANSGGGWNGGWGNLVVVDHGGGYITYYAHLASVSVSNGQKVAQGQQLGKIGTTGDSTGPHLHLCFYAPVWNSAKQRVESQRVDPLLYIAYPR
ncbi:MAG: peptidoglycan DD-metalloendopeptidase family protein [Clostridia bacterium]|nr:peptidoglycan DD-metalloendopeptidase family protein [Clostridia bacterium]